MTNGIGAFFSRMRWKLFKRGISWEIYDHIFPHLEGEADYEYPFRTDEELETLTSNIDIMPLLEATEEHIRDMPRAYGKAFRYLMHRDLRERLCMYERLARRNVDRECDHRFIAIPLEPSK